MSRFFILIYMVGLLHTLAAQPTLDKQGHRGCRGLMPENTIPAMKKALDLGVNTLEMDVVISSDKYVVVSHDAYMSANITLTPDGKSIAPSEENSYKLYHLPYAEIRRFDVGSKPYPKFPQQQKFATYKPLLSELIDSVEAYVVVKNLAGPFYNIEIKSTVEGDDVLHPKPQEFVDLVMDVLRKKDILNRVIIQSFDIRPLQILHQQYPDIKLAFLTANIKSVQSNLETLGFKPDIYSPYFKTVRKKTIKACHNQGIKVIPWTVNEGSKIEKLVRMGVDGIITDYPDLFKK